MSDRPFISNLHAVPQALRDIVKAKVDAYRSINAEAYRKLAAVAVIEQLMDEEGTEWVELRAQELATARRIRGLK